MPAFVASVVVLASALGADRPMRLEPPLHRYVEARAGEFDRIPPARKESLIQIGRYVRDRVRSNQPARLIFICTHNSRRSHLAQIWAQTAAAHYGVSGVETFSGGTEATAFNLRAVNALKRAGFTISVSQPQNAGNPRYQIRFHDQAGAMECFSKVYHQPPNPTQDFCAVMTCSQADESCPLVAGAAVRIALPYDDPKAFDDSPEEAAKYDERCQQIAREMLFVFANASLGHLDK